MDVKGAQALAERLAEAARNGEPAASTAVVPGDTSERASEVAATKTNEPRRVELLVEPA